MHAYSQPTGGRTGEGGWEGTHSCDGAPVTVRVASILPAASSSGIIFEVGSQDTVNATAVYGKEGSDLLPMHSGPSNLSVLVSFLSFPCPNKFLLVSWESTRHCVSHYVSSPTASHLSIQQTQLHDLPRRSRPAQNPPPAVPQATVTNERASPKPPHRYPPPATRPRRRPQQRNPPFPAQSCPGW